MADHAHGCPDSWQLVTHSSDRFCRKSTGSSCDSVTYSTRGLPYKQVCGQAIGFVADTPDGFYRYTSGACSSNAACTIDHPYVDGLSITHGSPRQHIWSFAAAGGYTPYCPCADRGLYLPPFVGNHYYCEEGPFSVDLGNPLWDGLGCDALEARCCQGEDIPWFCRDLGELTKDDIEVRLCADQSTANENIWIKLVELYVR